MYKGGGAHLGCPCRSWGRTRCLGPNWHRTWGFRDGAVRMLSELVPSYFLPEIFLQAVVCSVFPPLENTNILIESYHELDDNANSSMTFIRCHRRHAFPTRRDELGLGLVRGEVCAGILRSLWGAICEGT